MKSWRLLNTGPSDAFTNMALDEAILDSVSTGESPPTLRFYSWVPSAISIGYFQDVESEIRIDECRAMGIDVVRRLTGGRAVFHDRELTYSVIFSDADELLGKDILSTYKAMSASIIHGITSLGIHAELTKCARKVGRGSPSACFSSPSQYEITVDGRKLVGSAQRRRDGGILQHGSILMEFDKERLARLLYEPGDLEGVTSINEYAACSIEEIEKAIVMGFNEELGITFKNQSMSYKEIMDCEKLRREKYLPIS